VSDEHHDAHVAAHHHARLERVLLTLLAVLLGYVSLAYIVLPTFWRHYEHQRPLATLSMVTRTAQGIPGDPINVGLIGDTKEVLCAMNFAGWFPADPVTFRSSIEIAGISSISAGAKTLPSKSRPERVPIAATMCDSGRCSIAVRRTARCGSAPSPSTGASA